MRSTISIPASGANVLSRGIVGDLGGEIVVASPIYKQHFSLVTGRCLEEPELSVPAYLARVIDGEVWVRGKAGRRGASRRQAPPGGDRQRHGRQCARSRNCWSSHRERYDIKVFGAEPHGNYNRILLSPLLAGEKRRRGES